MIVETLIRTKDQAVHRILPEASMSECVKVLHERKIGALVVIDRHGGIGGIVSERDIVDALASRAQEFWDLQVSDIMTPREELITASPSDEVETLMGQMTSNRVRHLPILEGGRLVSLVSIGDVVKAQLDGALSENHHMREYIAGNA